MDSFESAIELLRSSEAYFKEHKANEPMTANDWANWLEEKKAELE